MTKLEIEKVLVVSTAHITEADNDILTSGNTELFIYYGKYFYQIPLNDTQVVDSKFSSAFKKLYEFAKTHDENFTHLKFDIYYGPLIDGFETFE